jgi:hypothetical protein
MTPDEAIFDAHLASFIPNKAQRRAAVSGLCSFGVPALTAVAAISALCSDRPLTRLTIIDRRRWVANGRCYDIERPGLVPLKEITPGFCVVTFNLDAVPDV